MPRKGLSRRELIEKDEITTTLERAAGFAIRNRKPILTSVAVVVVGVLLVIGWSLYRANQEANAQTALSQVIRAYGNTGAESTEARFNATIAEADRVREEFSGTQAADVAWYYAALSHQELGNTEEADRILGSLAETGDASIRGIARFALAESYKARGDLEAAIMEYEALVETGGYARGAVLFELGRLHESISEADAAREYYEMLIMEYPNSPFRSDADRALSRLGAVEGEGSAS